MQETRETTSEARTTSGRPLEPKWLLMLRLASDLAQSIVFQVIGKGPFVQRCALHPVMMDILACEDAKPRGIAPIRALILT